MIGYANDDPDWPGTPVDPPDEDSAWATGGITSTDDEDAPEEPCKPSSRVPRLPSDTQEPPK